MAKTQEYIKSRRKKAIEARKREIEYCDEWISEYLLDLKDFSDYNYKFLNSAKSRKEKREVIRKINDYEKTFTGKIKLKLMEAKGKDYDWVKLAGFYWWQRLGRYFKEYKKRTKKLMREDVIDVVEYNRATVDLMSKARTLFTTEEAALRNQYREAEEPKKVVDNVIYEYCAIFDEKTCSDCASAEGQKFVNGEGRIYLPQHPNCRCWYIIY